MDSQVHLTLAGSALDIQQTGSIYLSLSFGYGFGEKLCTEGTEDMVGIAGLPGDKIQRLPVLRHGPFTQDLTGEEEIESLLLHDPARVAEHHGMAVNAWIHVLAIPIFGLF
jgi:hypothetical protein